MIQVLSPIVIYFSKKNSNHLFLITIFMLSSGLFRIKKLGLSFIFVISTILLLSKTVLQRRPSIDPIPPNEITVHPSYSAISPPIFSQWTAKPCQVGEKIDLLIVVHSSPSHILHRKAIRQTWGSNAVGQGLNIRTVFAVGRSKLPRIQQRVNSESKANGDIVGVEMIDSYTNLTLKHVAGLRWAVKNCAGVEYVLKADDDAFVDVSRALKVIKSAGLSSSSIACRVVPQGTSPRRFGKWMVTRQDYPYDAYPEYCSGLAYFGRPSAMAKVYEAAVSGKVPYLWIDDVYLTGLAAQAAEVSRLDIGVWFARTEDMVIKWMKSAGDTKRVLPWIVAEMTPRHWPSEAEDLWRMIRMTQRKPLNSLR
ncbi:hypothetical protein JTE90_009197 [Oedothorax gibbosus]|uniref:Hexosyltransferase n=1 Tax=Oedothorax gibbosus TaxID=931172 RepID=A0AAV6UXF4_9ARAC|nr:hypothetical protein JTE90_009197 [Oedothorax gibbosus]